MRIPKRLMPHRVSVAKYQGAGTYGDSWDAPFTVKRGYCEDKQQNVTDELGEQQLSSGFVILDPEWVIPLKSKITVWPSSANERTCQVIAVARFQHPAAPSHQVLYLK